MSSLLPALLVLAAASASPQAALDPKARVDAVFQEYDRSDSPGCALGVYRDGKIIYERGYGMSNLELGVANSPQSVFDIGSTGKQFTAFSIHLLARDGKLSLDDDIRKWVPEIPSYGKTITIRNLLHHTGGLRDYIELMEFQGVKYEDLTTDADTLAILALQKAPNFPPGEEYLYSNTGYFLLSVVVRRASGQLLRDFAAERIFGPLSMRHTQFNESHTRIIPNRATGYGKAKGGGFGIDMGDWEQNGDGGVLTTVEDLQLWDQNFYDPKVGDRRLLDAMLTVGVLNDGRKLDYASALVLGSYKGLPTVSHGGAWVGYRAQILRFPEQKFTVACLCNLEEAEPGQLAQQVAEIYLGELMKAEAAKAAAQAPKKAEPPKAAMSLEQVRRLAGAYRNPESGQILTLVMRENRLEGDMGHEKLTFVPIAPGRLRIDGLAGARGEVQLEGGARGVRPRLQLTTIGEDGEGEKGSFEPVELWFPSPAELKAMAGAYASAELDTTWRLVVEDGKLFVRHRNFPTGPLKPTTAETFTIGGVDLVFARDGSKRITGFTLNAGRVRGIVFRKQATG